MNYIHPQWSVKTWNQFFFPNPKKCGSDLLHSSRPNPPKITTRADIDSAKPNQTEANTSNSTSGPDEAASGGAASGPRGGTNGAVLGNPEYGGSRGQSQVSDSGCWRWVLHKPHRKRKKTLEEIMCKVSGVEQKNMSRARICTFLRRSGIDSEDSIPPAYAAWRAGTSNRVVARARQDGNRFLGSLKGLQIRGSVFPVKTRVTVSGVQFCAFLNPGRNSLLPPSLSCSQVEIWNFVCL